LPDFALLAAGRIVLDTHILGVQPTKEFFLLLLTHGLAFCYRLLHAALKV
jgi:hypothetical protein